jgi:hypothetical protein
MYIGREVDFALRFFCGLQEERGSTRAFGTRVLLGAGSPPIERTTPNAYLRNDGRYRNEEPHLLGTVTVNCGGGNT